MTDIEKPNQKEHPDLYKRSIKGGYWVFAIKAATQFFGFVKSIIVFNFLFNENLELIFVANLLMAALTTFSESGFRAALVQKKEDIESYLDTAWVIGILRGIVLFTAIYFAAPLFASFKVEPEKMSLAIGVIRAMGVCFLIRAFQNIGVVYFRKELEFHKIFGLTMAGSVADIVLSISLLLIYRNVWAVVIARLASAIINLAASYWLCPYRPKFHFIPEKARELWKFGKWLFGGNIIGYLLNEGDDWFVLFFFPDSLPFKLYRGAYRFANMPATHITNTISQVSFPAYSKIQNDISRLREAYLKVLQITVLISVPVAFLIFTLGPDFVRLFLVEESHAMIPVLQILAIYGLVRSIGATRGALFPATGNVHIVFRFSLIRIGLLIITIYPLTDHWGIAGTAASILLARLLVGPLGLLLASRILRCSIWSMIREYLLPLSASILTGGVILLLKMYLFKELTRLSFLGLLLTGILIYLIVICIVGITFKSGIYLNIKEQKELFFSKKRRSPD
jgi:O-antigen/teichoic acid export membrane protein